MKRKLIPALMMILVLCAVLAGAEAAGKQTKGVTCPRLETYFETWYYNVNTLPAGMEACDYGSPVELYPEGSWEGEVPTICEVTFVSGNEELRNAFDFWVEDEYSSPDFGVSGTEMKSSGQAVFHIRMESESYIYEQDRTLYVYDYDDCPIVELLVPDSVLTLRMKKGDSISATEIADRIFSFHTEEAVQNISPLPKGLQDPANYMMGAYIDNPYEEEPNAKLVTKWQDTTKYFTVLETGTYELYASFLFGNAYCDVAVNIIPDGSAIEGPNVLRPGAAAAYTVSGELQGVPVTWSVEEGDASVDETGMLTAGDAAGKVILAASAEGAETLRKEIAVSAGITWGMEFGRLEWQGFLLPEPDAEGWNSEKKNSQILSCVSPDGTVQYESSASVNRSIVGDAGDAITVYDLIELNEDLLKEITSWDTYTPDDWPVRCFLFETWEDGQFKNYGMIIYYARDMYMVRYILYSGMPEGGSREDTVAITREDAETLVAQMGYDSSKAPITAADVALTVTEKDGLRYVSAGKKAFFSATFANPEKVGNYTELRWYIDDCPPYISIHKYNGTLTVDSRLKEAAEIKVTVCSYTFGNIATYTITVLPAVRKVTAEPATLTLYAGDPASQTVRVTLDPDSVPVKGITWKAAKEGIVEIVPSADGDEASFTAAAAGKTTVTVTEPGGKNTKLNVVVTEPVADIELAVKGSPKPGKTVTVSATLSPKNAGNKNVSWSVDVPESVASINSKGQLKISRDAEPGTVITVTCTAEGAPAPVVRTLAVTVE